MKRQVTDALRAQFRPGVPEPRRRDHRLPRAVRGRSRAIVDLLLTGLERRLAEQDFRITLTPAARRLIVREGTDPAFGARPLKRTIQRLVENPLARALLKGEFSPGDHDHGRRGPGLRGPRLLDRSLDGRRRSGSRRDARATPAEREPAGPVPVVAAASPSSTCRASTPRRPIATAGSSSTESSGQWRRGAPSWTSERERQLATEGGEP
jgi:hypothetical protein